MYCCLYIEGNTMKSDLLSCITATLDVLLDNIVVVIVSGT